MAEKSKRGFAAMTEQKRRAIASMGGQAAHAKGVAHQFTSKEAREAGRKGGKILSKDRAYMAAIGRKGGQHSRREEK
jgi:general stress protein YciG